MKDLEEKFAAFFQIKYDGAADSREKVDNQLMSIEMLYEQAKDANIPEGSRLLIVESDFFGKGWEWIKDYPGTISQENWNTEGPVVLNALNALS